MGLFIRMLYAARPWNPRISGLAAVAASPWRYSARAQRPSSPTLPHWASSPKALLVKLESATPSVVTMASWVNQEAPTSSLGVMPKVPRAPKLFLPLTSFRLSPWPL